MDWIQVDAYMIIVEREKTFDQYEILEVQPFDFHHLFQAYIANDELANFLGQFGIDGQKPSALMSLAVEEGEGVLFTGKYYFEGYIELGEFDLWDIFIGTTVFSFTQDEAAPFSSAEASYVELSFEMVVPMNQQ